MSAWGGIDLDDEVQDIASPTNFDVDVEEFLSNLDLNSPDSGNDLQRLLIESCQNGNYAAVKEILANQDANKLIDINKVDEAGSTALTYASCFGHELVVAELLRFGANVDLQDKNGWTPLMWAANNNHLAIVKQLISAGADKQIKTTTGSSVLDLAGSGSASALYLHGQDDSGAGEFYQEAVDPFEVEAQFSHDLKESAEALGGFSHTTTAGVQEDDLDDPDIAVLAAPVTSTNHTDFDWNTFMIRDSFALPKDKIPEFLNIVITDVQPTLQKNQAPVSANALFLAIRYMFYCGNTESFTALTSPICRRITMVVEEHQGDLAYLTYWLANTEILRYYLQKDGNGLREATEKDLQQMLFQLVQLISEKIQEQSQRLLTPLITTCILNYNSIPEYGNVQYRDEWKIFKNKASSSSNSNNPSDLNELAKKHMLPPSYETLMKNPGPQRVTSVLSSLLFLFQIYGIHPITQSQIFAQLLFFITSRLFNTIINERKYLNRRRAIQIRLNISVVEDWCRNHNFRPESGELLNGKTYDYKSLIEIGRTFLAPLVQLLAWLQTFSGFGNDFTNVVSTLQELKALNPKQLLKSATNYRFETREAPLSKDYKEYLKELARHYSVEPKHQAFPPLKEETPKETQDNKDTSTSKKPDAASTANNGLIDLMSDPISSTPSSKEQKAVQGQVESQDSLTPHTFTSANADTSRASGSSKFPSTPPQTFVLSTYSLPVADDIFLDESLNKTEHVPFLFESDEVWGQEDVAGVSESIGGRYLVPYLDQELTPKLATMLNGSQADEENVHNHEHSDIEEPDSATKPLPDETTDLDMGAPTWTIDDSPASVW